MNVNDMILVSVDDHVVEPPDMFDGHLAEKYRSVAPRVRQTANGDDVWVYEGQELPNIGLNAVAGKPPGEYGIEPTSFAEMRKGCWDIEQRIADMDANGILGSMCFPSFPQFCGQLFSRTEDKDVAMAMVRAYNIPAGSSRWPSRRSGIRTSWPTRCDAWLRKGVVRSRSPRTPRSSDGPAITATTGTPSGARSATPEPSCACTSGRRRNSRSHRSRPRST